MNTTTFTTGDVIQFESGTRYQVLGIEPDGRLLARGLRDGQLFGSQRHLDPSRCKLIRRADAQQAAPVQQTLPEPAPVTGAIPRVNVWESIAKQETSLHNAIQAARLGSEAKDAVDSIVAAIAEGTQPDPADYGSIRAFVDHIDGPAR